MTTNERKTTKKTYEQPELEVMAFELGVYGNYGDPGDPGLRPDISLGFGTSSG